MTRILFFTTIFGTILGLFACARVGVPTGGLKDTTPPKIDSLASSPNFSTHFQSNRIQLVFDEWIVLKDPATQILISPPLEKRPDISLKGKAITVKFAAGEVLRPNTTYTINFGSAVQDLHEGNIAPDLRFVFSTGDFIDSLIVSGAVLDAFTGDPVENITVALYEDMTDSVAKQQKPYYFGKTNKNGLYTLQNIKAGTFKMLALEDKDQNLKWSGDNESIAFADTTLLVRAESFQRFTQLRLFKDQARFRLFERNANRYGLIKLTYTGSPDSVPLRVDPDVPGLRLLRDRDLDTLLVWYDLPTPTLWQLLAGDDTIPIRDLSRDAFFKTYRLGLAQPAILATGSPISRNKFAAATPAATLLTTPVQPVKSVNQNPNKRGLLDFATPITSLDTTKWTLVADSSRVTDFTVRSDSTTNRRLVLDLAWKPGKIYALTLSPGAVTDFYGIGNVDTLRQNFTVFTDKQLGGLNLTVKELHSAQRYILQLLNGKDVVEERIFRADGVEKKFVFANLVTATYTGRIVEDNNGNGRWDTGDYYAHRQPERVFTKKLESLRANWEVEATMDAAVDKGNNRRDKKTN